MSKDVGTLIAESARANLDGDAALAVKLGKRATEVDPTHAVAWAALGSALASWGDDEGALNALLRGVELDPTEPSVRGELAQIYRARGDVDKALGEYRRVADLDASDYAISHASLLSELGQHGQALSVLDAALPNADAEIIDVLRATRAVVAIEHTMSSHWTEVVEDDKRSWLPCSLEAVEATEAAISSADSLPELPREYSGLVEEARRAVSAARVRRYDGGFLVPGGSALLGGGLVWWGLTAPAESTAHLIGAAYLLCAGVYLHAARVQEYRWNARRMKDGGEGFFARLLQSTGSSKSDAGAVAGCLTALLGASVAAVLAPVVVAYHYVRNYVMG